MQLNTRTNNEDSRRFQGFDPKTSTYGNMVSYSTWTESLGCRIGNLSRHATHHHDLSTTVTTRSDENVKKLKEVFKENNPFKEMELFNIITKAVMQDQVKDTVLTGDQNGLELNSRYVKDHRVWTWHLGSKKKYTCRHGQWQVQLKRATQQQKLLF